MKTNKLQFLNLQLFAEGSGDGSGSVSADSGFANSQGVNLSQAANANNADDTGNDRAAQFEQLIKGEFKDLYDARVQDTIQKRLKSSKETVDKFNSLAPTIEMLSRKYGVDASDITALNKAIEEDDSYYEEEALEKGVPVEQLKAIKKMERENAELKRQIESRQRQESIDRTYAEWLNQSESLKSIYPNFDLRSELQNPTFQRLLSSNVDVRTAFEVVHKDEILPTAMRFAANQAKKNVTNSIIANGYRPNENSFSNASATTKLDVANMTKEQRQELARQAARGVKVKL